MIDKIRRIQELIDKKLWLILREELAVLEPFEVGDIIENLGDEDGVIVFRLLSREQAKETFQHLPIERQEQAVEAFANNVSRLTNLLNDLDPDDRTAFFEELPGQLTQKLIQYLRPEERSVAKKLLGYPEDSIGRLMTPEFIAVRPEFTVSQTLEHIRKFGTNSETLNVIYVVNERWKLLDDLTIREILLAGPDDNISGIMDGNSYPLAPSTTRKPLYRFSKTPTIPPFPLLTRKELFSA
jgi:magnesium transporter